MNSSVIRIEVLNRENYDTWKLQMQALLTKNNAWMYVSGELQKPEVIEGNATTLAALENWKRGDNKAKSDIILSVSPCELKLIKGCDTFASSMAKIRKRLSIKTTCAKSNTVKTAHVITHGRWCRH